MTLFLNENETAVKITNKFIPKWLSCRLVQEQNNNLHLYYKQTSEQTYTTYIFICKSTIFGPHWVIKPTDRCLCVFSGLQSLCWLIKRYTKWICHFLTPFLTITNLACMYFCKEFACALVPCSILSLRLTNKIYVL